MRATLRYLAVAIGIGLLAFGVAVYADVHTATYKGSQLCVACHKSTHKQIAEAYPKTGHALSFWKVGAEKEGEAILGDFSKDPGFTRAQVAYVLGSGKREQAYLDKDFQLLPLFWEVESKSWVKRMPSVDGAVQCLPCHTTGYELAKKTWVEPGVGCESCHGPGSEHITASDKKGSIIRPETLNPLREAMICGQCHSLGQAKSSPSPRSMEYRPGDDLTTTFTDAKPSAHLLHQLPPWTQYSEWVQSTHATATPPTTCTTCHEPHGVSKLPYQLRKQGNTLCLDCHKALSGPQHEPAALETHTCVSCHMPQGSHFFRKPEV